MPPNLSLKAGFVRAHFDSTKKKSDDSIRTDFVLQNIYAHLVKDVSNFQAVIAANYREENIIRELEGIVDSFKLSYASTLQGICSQIHVTRDTLSSILQGVSNELFCEGITWSRIVALFVFVGELTLQYLSENLSDDIVDSMYECFCRLAKENLTGWIEDHGGWDGVRSLSKVQQGESNPQENTQSTNKGWAKSFLHGTVRMIGTLAQIANTTGQTFP